jgi:putative endonuclease
MGRLLNQILKLNNLAAAWRDSSLMPFGCCAQNDIIKLGRGYPMSRYYVYMMTSAAGTLYTGVTNDLKRRVYEHKHKLIEGFTKKFNVTRLVYYEETDDIQAALAREKQIKGWLRRKKIALIKSVNPKWQDLSEGWYE